MSREDERRRRRAELAVYLVAAGSDLEIARHLADQVPEFVGRARQDQTAGSNVGLFASVKLLEELYSAIEAVLERTESVFAAVPATKEWHKDLLWGMASDVPGFRPRVLAHQTVGALEEFLRFRHFGRHGSYRERVLLERVLALAGNVESTMRDLSADLAAFWKYAEAGVQELQ